MAPIRSRAAEEGSFEIPWWGIPLVLIVLYVCLFSGLGAIGLVGPDEPRYAAIARAMADTHDWITPRLWGTPWFEKPVLYYWTAGIAMRLFGVSEFAARLPSACAGLLAVLAVAWAALRSYGIGAAWYSLLMLPTSVAMIGFSRAAGPDMLFAGFLTAAMAVALEMLQKDRPGTFLKIAFGFFLGAAVLAKGPAAVILAGGATLVWAALTRQWRAPFRFLHPLVILAFCVTTLPWYILCALRNPDFLRVFIWQHNFERYLTPVFEHRQPFWFFIPVFLLGILPWLPVLVLTGVDGIHERYSAIQQRSPSIFIACWSIFTLLFFSASQSKLPGYILPAIPPAVLLLAVTLRREFGWAFRSRQIAAASIGFMALVVIGVAFMEWRAFVSPGTQLDSQLARALEISLMTALLGAGFISAFALRRKWSAVVWPGALSVVALILVANGMILPTIDASISVRSASARAMAERSLKPGEVALMRVPRAYQFGLDYYFNSSLPEWTPDSNGVKAVFCGADAVNSADLMPFEHQVLQVTPDGKIFVAILHP